MTVVASTNADTSELPASTAGFSSFMPLLSMVAILITGIVVRIGPLVNVPMWWDEVWSMWQTQGSLAQTINLTPYDWPPLYYVLLRFWTFLVGPNDVTGRVLSLLFALLGIALIYRAGRALGSKWAGLFAALLFAILPYTAYLTIEARGYAVLLMAAPLTAWLHIRWLNKPTIRRTLPYMLSLALCIYATYTGALLVALCVGHALIYTIVRRERRIWRSWALTVSGVIVLLLPLAVRVASLAQVRRQNIADHLAPVGIESLLPNFYGWLAGDQPLLWTALILLAVVGLITWARAISNKERPFFIRNVSLLAAWAIGAPLFMYAFRYWLLLGAVRYLSYMVPGVILAAALGLSRFPRAIRYALIIPILLYAVAPLPFQDFRPALSDEKPTRDIVRYLGQSYQPGDQVLIDPQCNCGRDVEWSYYESIYYPGGLMATVPDVSGAGRRLWYVSDQRSAEPAIRQQLAANRVRTAFFGPYYDIAELYEAPPRADGLLFGDSLRFFGADLPDQRPLHAGDSVNVRLWWTAAKPIPVDYSFALYVIAPDGSLVTQTDGGPQGAFVPDRTSAWQTGSLYVDQRTLTLPDHLKAGSYTIELAAYQWWDNIRLSPDPALGTQIDRALVLGSVSLFNY